MRAGGAGSRLIFQAGIAWLPGCRVGVRQQPDEPGQAPMALPDWAQAVEGASGQGGHREAAQTTQAAPAAGWPTANVAVGNPRFYNGSGRSSIPAIRPVEKESFPVSFPVGFPCPEPECDLNVT